MARQTLPITALLLISTGAGLYTDGMSFHRGVLIAALALVAAGSAIVPARAESSGRVFEMRTYTTPEGRLPDLLARFRNHTIKLFEKHGIQNIGYWIPRDVPNTLIYIIAYPNREAAGTYWKAFTSDPEWKKAAAASEVNGKIVIKVEQHYMDAADFSGIK